MRLRRPLRALQVEPSTRCTRQCLVCPRTALADRWRGGDLDGTTWSRLRPDLQLARHVHLQGWGEPLLHPELRSMVRDAREAGCRVGLTTNGDLLEGNISWIVEERVDLVAVSVAGAPPSHARLRDGSDLESAWRSVSALARHRRHGRPKLQISYLLTALNAEDLSEVVRAARASGADELFVIHLDMTLTVELARAAAFTTDGLRPGVGAALDRAADRARREDLAFREPARHSEELLACALDPTRFAFVSWNGRVAPCVNLGLPVDGPITRISEDERHELTPVTWGNLREQSLQDILEGERAGRFRAPFIARKAAEHRFLSAQRGSGRDALERLERSACQREAELEQNPFPSACDGCPKRVGW